MKALGRLRSKYIKFRVGCMTLPRCSARIPPHEFRTLMCKTLDHYERTREWVCTENTLKFLDDIGALRVPNASLELQEPRK